MSEAHIRINGVSLTDTQSSIIRVALGFFLDGIQRNGLGEDELGKKIAQGYLTRGSEVSDLIHG